VTDIRVAVISSSLHEDMNVLWRATARLVDEQILIGPRSTASSGSVGQEVLPLADRDLGPNVTWQRLSHLRSELRRFGPDLVHVNGELWTVRALQVVASKYPFVAHGAENLWSHGYPIEQAIRRRLVRRSLDRSRGYASWNVQGAGHITRVVGDANFPICVVPAVIPPEVFRQTRWQVPRSDRLWVLLVGRLDRQKGFHLVLEAAASWPERIAVTICGDGPEREALARQAARLGVSTRFVGQVDSTTLARLMADHSVLLQPSITTPSLAEQFGRSVAEGICVGIPVLTSTSGELPNVMGGEPRWTFDEDSVPAVHDALSGLVDQPLNVPIAMNLAQRGLARQVDPTYAASKIVNFWHRAALFESAAERR
jgi:glycosyltransferase involved in cell wall biosynthesis